MPFQEEAVQKMCGFLLNGRGVYNACEQGLGKCLQTIETCRRIGATKILVICPATVRLVWKSELTKWTAPGQWSILSYDSARKQASEVWKAVFDVIVLDEAHYLKNPKALRTKAVLHDIWPNIPYKICLSGTPFTQSVLDCWPIFSRLAPEHFSDYFKFAYRYTKVKRNRFGTTFEGIKNHEELKTIINSKFFFRYTKEQVLPELPEKTFQKIPLPSSLALKMSSSEQAEHEHYLELLKEAYAKKSFNLPTPPKSVATKRREQGLLKVKEICAFAKDILDAGTPLVIFGYHTDFLDALYEKLAEFTPVRISGSTTAAGRADAVDRFQAGHTSLFIGQLVAAGTGITLTRSSVCLLAELDWSPAVISQAVDRLHRIGQRSAVTVYYPVVSDSIDERIAEVVLRKSETFKKILE